MSSRLQRSMWFAVPFLVALVVLTGLRLWLANDNNPVPQSGDTSTLISGKTLVEHTLPFTGILEAQSRAPIAEQGLTLPDTAVVILLGGIGCSTDQVELLRYWSERTATTGSQDYPVLALYADPQLSIEQSAYESLPLRRVSQATFPFLVSQDPDFNLRAMGIRTPQVVLVESRVITHVFNPVIEPSPSVPQ